MDEKELEKFVEEQKQEYARRSKIALIWTMIFGIFAIILFSATTILCLYDLHYGFDLFYVLLATTSILCLAFSLYGTIEAFLELKKIKEDKWKL